MSRRLIIALVAVAASLSFAASSNAASPKSITLSAPKSVGVNYTHCFDASGRPLPCVTIDFTVINGTSSSPTCQVTDLQTGFEAFDSVVGAGMQSGGELTTPYISGMKAVTLVLSCNGATVPGETQRVRVTVS
jgi:hypothetical protein